MERARWRFPPAFPSRDPKESVNMKIHRNLKLNTEELTRIHDATLNILQEKGIRFQNEDALKTFKSHGAKVDRDIVHLDGAMVESAIESAPQWFILEGRDPKKSVTMGRDEAGRDHLAIAPGYGSCHILSPTGEMRSPLRADFDNFCKLVHTSNVVSMNGCLMVEPLDVDPSRAHLPMLQSTLTLSDKPFIGSSVSLEGARQSYEMAEIVWGGDLEDRSVMISVINSLSPLQYSREMADVIMEYARNGQANMLAGMAMSGATGPASLAGTLVVQNAEFLAGIVLAQLTRPEAPVVYGGTATILDMRTGTPAVGAPEQSILQRAQAQLARFYQLPCRGSGGISDAFIPDYQAAMESSLSLSTILNGGCHFIFQSVGVLASYLAASYEKFVMDEEIIAHILHTVEPFDVGDEALDLETIKSVGIGGEYLSHPTTFQRCRTAFHLPELRRRQSHDSWMGQGARPFHELAGERVAQRLGAYVAPEMDGSIRKELDRYVEKRM